MASTRQVVGGDDDLQMMSTLSEARAVIECVLLSNGAMVVPTVAVMMVEPLRLM